MPAAHTFEYAIIRVVPFVERGEFLNAGMILSCRGLRYLAARVELDRTRLLALAPTSDCDEIARHLQSYVRICAGDPAAGPLASLTKTERFHWLVAPRSTVIQTSPVHAGRCADPAAELAALFERVVRVTA